MGDTEGSAKDFLAFALRLRKTPKTSVKKPSGAHSSATSHCFKWGPFLPNEVGRVTPPAPLAKPIRIRPEGRSEKILIWDGPYVPLLNFLGGCHSNRRSMIGGSAMESDNDCPVEPTAPGGCSGYNRFRPKPRVPSLVGHLPRVSYVCLVGQSLEGK